MTQNLKILTSHKQVNPRNETNSQQIDDLYDYSSFSKKSND